MERNPVTSSNIASVGYDEDAQLLEVEFANNAVYQYSKVPTEVYEEFVNAESVGRYLAKNIKNQYEFTKVS